MNSFIIVLIAAFAIAATLADIEKVVSKVFFDIEIDGVAAGRVVMGLFGTDFVVSLLLLQV